MKPALGIRDITEENLQFAKQIGATAIVAVSPSGLTVGNAPYYEYERVVQLKSRVEAAGLELAAIQNIPTSWYDKIVWGLPGREEQLDNYCRTLINVGRAGVPVMHYNFHAIRVWRTSRHARVRGNALTTAYDHALMENAPVERAALSADQLWENFELFLRRIIPAAESVGLKMALHPDDPPISPIAGAACLFIDVPAFQRVLDMVPSPSNGLLFCQGCYTEMLGQNVFDAIRHFGKQGKIFYVHFRNVLGQMPSFSETFIDDGDIDMFEALKVYKEVGFDGAFIPDHLPHVTGDSTFGHAANAHAVGYMRGMMQALGVLS